MQGRFDLKRDAVAAEPFTFAGRAFKLGEPFPHKDLGIIPLELEGLWRTGRIRFVEPSPTTDLDLAKLTPSELAALEAATAPPRGGAKPDRRARR